MLSTNEGIFYVFLVKKEEFVQNGKKIFERFDNLISVQI